MFVSRGVVTGRRWAFTPILLTQVLFGAAAVSFFGAAETAARVVWGVVLVYVSRAALAVQPGGSRALGLREHLSAQWRANPRKFEQVPAIV